MVRKLQVGKFPADQPAADQRSQPMVNNNIKSTNKKTCGSEANKNSLEKDRKNSSNLSKLQGSHFRFFSGDPEKLGRGAGWYRVQNKQYLRKGNNKTSQNWVVIRGLVKEDFWYAQSFSEWLRRPLLVFEPEGEGAHYKAVYGEILKNNQKEEGSK